MSNTPRRDALDPTRLHVGEVYRLSPVEASDWLRIYKRSIPIQLRLEGLGRPLADETELPKTLVMEMNGARCNLAPGEYPPAPCRFRRAFRP